VFGTTTVTVTKGAACADAGACAPGQRCEEGRCFWDPPVGELGAACTYPQYCTSGTCESEQCTRPCFVSVGDCPAGFTCTAPEGADRGFCFLPVEEEEPGDCNASGGGSVNRGILFAPLALFLAGVLRRRRR
jgi:MYXO-CTERM domain-containing protein